MSTCSLYYNVYSLLEEPNHSYFYQARISLFIRHQNICDLVFTFDIMIDGLWPFIVYGHPQHPKSLAWSATFSLQASTHWFNPTLTLLMTALNLSSFQM